MKRMMACVWALRVPCIFGSAGNRHNKTDIAVGKAPYLDATHKVATCSTPFGCARNPTLPCVSVDELAINTAGGKLSLITSSCASPAFSICKRSVTLGQVALR